jgi:hypothetical protein
MEHLGQVGSRFHPPIPQDFIPQVPLESEAEKAHPSPPATVKVKAGAWGLNIVLC